MITKLDKAIYQFIGYQFGTWAGIVQMVREMGLSKTEWDKIKTYLQLDQEDYDAIEKYFNETKTITP